jgi:hypothetical protein
MVSDDTVHGFDDDEGEMSLAELEEYVEWLPMMKMGIAPSRSSKKIGRTARFQTARTNRVCG